jgi:hypothetical protein
VPQCVRRCNKTALAGRHDVKTGWPFTPSFAASGRRLNSMHLPVEDAERQLQVMLSDGRFPAALQLLGYASAVALAKCEATFRLQEPKKRIRDKAAHACRALSPSRTASSSSPASARSSPRKDTIRWSIGFPRRRTACQLSG